VLKSIQESAEVVGVVAHPPDPEDGIRYESVFDFAQHRGWKAVRGKARDATVSDFVEGAKPDLLWITDYRYLIAKEVLALPLLGTVNLHPSLLPAYRGRASINWAILNGETKLGLTGHFVDEGMDSGDIIEQVSYEIDENQDVGDCLNILYPIYTSMTTKILSHFLAGKVPRRSQDHSRATAFTARKPEDGLIDWNQPARRVLNLVRAVAAPYPGAFTTSNGKKLTVWKARVVSDTDSGSQPGRVLETNSSEILVQCGRGTIALLQMETESKGDRPAAGHRLGS
jgi:methionyl-tRNA formyltransferase